MQATDRTVYVGNVGKEVDEAALLALFGHCGAVTQIRIAGEPSYDTRYAFIEFTTPEEANTALLLDGMTVFERPIKVNMARGGSGPGIVRSNDPDRVQRTIHVGGLPFDEIQEETLAEYFGHVGEVNAVRKSGRFAWIEFATLQAAQQALALDGESLGNGMMKVSASKTPIHTAGWRAPKFRDPPPASPKSAAPPSLPSAAPPAYVPPPVAGQPGSAPLPYGVPSQAYGGPPPYPPPAASGFGPRPPPGPPPPQYGGAPPPQYGGPPQGPPPGAYPPMQGGPPPQYGGPPAGPPQHGAPPPYGAPPQYY